MDGFVDVTVDATGVVTRVPADWIGHPVLGNGITPVEPEPAPEAVDLGEPPTKRSTTAELEAYAEQAGIDLGEASNNAERLQVIESAIAAMPTADPPPAGNSDVQLVAGDDSDVSPYPVTQAAQGTTTDPDGTESSTEDPATGNEEN